jgi:hypothetical protein
VVQAPILEAVLVCHRDSTRICVLRT